MTLLLENPLPIVVVGVIAVAVLGVLFLNTRRGAFLAAIAGVLLAVAAGVAIERLWVTDREQVEETLYGAAKALAANDMPGVERRLSKTAQATLGRLRHYMGWVEFSEVNLRNVEVELNDLTVPPTAVANLDGNARFRDRTGTLANGYYAGSFQVELIRESDGWKIDQVEGDPYGPPIER